MNTYTATFLFKGEYYFVSFTSDMLANSAVMEDDFNDYKFSREGQHLDYKIYHKGKEYMVNFNFSDIKKFNVYDDEDCLVEKEIPYIVLKVENDEGVVYNIVENI